MHGKLLKFHAALIFYNKVVFFDCKINASVNECGYVIKFNEWWWLIKLGIFCILEAFGLNNNYY